jgi:hypothetical protein
MKIPSDDALDTYYVDINDRTTVTCPKCEGTTTLDLARYRETASKLAVTCRCGTKFKARFEYRTIHRKEVELEGELRNARTGEREEMEVDRISLEGMGLRTSVPSDIRPGDRLDVTFQLDNKVRSLVNRTVKVVSVRGKEIGTVFAEAPRNATVGFYLMD